VTQFGDLSLLKQHHVARLHHRDRAILSPCGTTMNAASLMIGFDAGGTHYGWLDDAEPVAARRVCVVVGATDSIDGSRIGN
jgi:hypothetical protein